MRDILSEREKEMSHKRERDKFHFFFKNFSLFIVKKTIKKTKQTNRNKNCVSSSSW